MTTLGSILFWIFMVAWALLLTLFALASIAAYLNRTHVFPEPESAVALPFARPPVIEPIDESDPFCTCPKCGLLGTHGLKVEQSIRELVFLEDDHAGNRTAVWKHCAGLQLPDSTWLVVRQCWACKHEWKTFADQPKGT